MESLVRGIRVVPATGDRPRRLVLTLAGELDLHSASGLRRELLDALGREGGECVLDVARLEFCDAAGLGVLVGTQRRAIALGGRVRLAAPPPHLLRLLRITRLTLALPTYDTVADAFEALNNPGATPVAPPRSIVRAKAAAGRQGAEALAGA